MCPCCSLDYNCSNAYLILNTFKCLGKRLEEKEIRKYGAFRSYWSRKNKQKQTKS